MSTLGGLHFTDLGTALPTLDRPTAVEGRGSGQRWPAAYASLLLAADCAAIVLALVTTYLLRCTAQEVTAMPYLPLLVLAGIAWVTLLAFHGGYDVRLLGAGPREFRQVTLASFRLWGGAAIVCYAIDFGWAREFVVAGVPFGLALLLIGRYTIRKWLHRRRQAGGWSHRVLVIGDPDRVDELSRVVARDRYAGFSIVGACFPGGFHHAPTNSGVPSLGPLAGAVDAAKAAGCDTIAVTASPGITARTLRRLAWELERTGISLVVAPALTDVAGPRISIHPVAGLPLLHVDEPELGTLHRTVKRVMDLAVAAVALVLLSPVILAIAVAVKTTSRGPVVFRQTRVGRDGKEFRAYKFRSMHVDAEARLAGLRERNESPTGVLFKMRDDPRVTGIGRHLRRFSLDELPQLWNVVKGDMSVVGPRPPLPSEVAQYGDDVRRRLLVKPGVTGLWQVSGRSDLSWEDSVRLDLYYVENWSPVLDIVILVRTAFAVVRGTGAY